jgi:phosphatidylserine/phosphatidylglycerophosphate/cardiolipin synthase-like enzyme
MVNPTKRQFKNSDFMMLSRPGYFRQLIDDLAKVKKGDRVVVTTMGFTPTSPEVGAVADALNAAAARGATVSFLMDAFDFLINVDTKIPGPLWRSTAFSFDRRMREPFRSKLNALKAFHDNGGVFTVTNQPGKILTWPFTGRSHIKAVVINDIVYAGGCNLNQPHEIDIMLRWRDPDTADWLYELLMNAEKHGNVRKSLNFKDQIRKVDDKTNLMVDAGVVGRSAIFDEALSMIDNAKDYIIFTSQYFAPGLGIKALHRAHQRGVKITYYYSHYSMHGPIEGTLHRIAQWRERQRLPADLFERQLPRDQHLHAKVLATENGVLIGSHNYGDMGVNVGTAEIAIKRNDAAFGKQAAAFIEELLNITA